MISQFFEIISLLLAATIVIAWGWYSKYPRIVLIVTAASTLGLIVGANLVDEHSLPWLSNIDETLGNLFALHLAKLLRIMATVGLLFCCWHVAGGIVTLPEPIEVPRDNRRYFNR